MNPDDQIRELLARAVPPAPTTETWAGAVRGRRRNRLVATVVTTLAIALLVPAGIFVFSGNSTPAPIASPPMTESIIGTEVVGNGMIFQAADAEAPVVCMGAMDASYPPQCAGPTINGDFSWNDVEHTQEGGARWSNETHQVQGYYDPTASELGSFTLTQPLAPANYPPEEMADFPQLCSDPLRGADPTKTGESNANTLTAKVDALDVVGFWVSNGSDAYNLLVRGDADAIHDDLRAVWGGELCVVSSDQATERERTRAMNRVFRALPDRQLAGGSPAFGTEPIVDIELIYLDAPTLETIKEAADRIPVRITTLITPVGEDNVFIVETTE